MNLTKKQQIEVTAKDLFWNHGFKDVTIADICKEAKVSRKQFYRYYEDKTELVVFILSKMLEDVVSEKEKEARLIDEYGYLTYFG